MSSNAVVGGHYGGPLDPPTGPPGSGPLVGGPNNSSPVMSGGRAQTGNIEDILQQIMNITDQSLDEAQAR